MPIRVECECGKTLQAPDKAAGRKVRCKACGAAVEVPGGDEPTFDVDEDEFSDLPPPPSRVKASKLPAAVGKKGTGKPKKAATAAAAAAGDSGVPKWLIPAAFFVAFCVGGVGGFFGIRALLNAGGGTVVAKAVPDNFLPHQCEDGHFSFDYPEGWEVASGGGTGGVPPWGTFTKGDVSFDMRGDSKGAPIADMATAGGQMDNEELPELSPVARVHAIQYDIKYRFVFDNMEEQPGGFYETPFGRGWLAEFTATEGAFGSSKIHGYRLTLLGGMHQFNVICKCPEKLWETYKPVFERAMKSIKRT
jgi:hypothetical protein